MKFKKGDIAWVCDSDAGWIRVEITKVLGDSYVLRRPDLSAIFGVESRHLLTDEEFKKLRGN